MAQPAWRARPMQSGVGRRDKAPGYERGEAWAGRWVDGKWAGTLCRWVISGGGV